MAAQHTPRFTPEQYLEMERAAEYKSEYYRGEIFAMAGASYAHGLLISHLNFELLLGLRGRPCHVITNDLRVRTGQAGLYTYPDLVAICGEPRFEDNRPDTLLNPVLIVEVLSKSTESNDRGLKFHEYGRIESLQQYVLVSQETRQIEVFTRAEEGAWTYRDFQGADAVCEFSSLGCSVNLADVYRDVPIA
jgi:Uma2 family endonuclease